MADTTVVGTDTYATQVALAAYLATRLGTDAWDTASEANRIKASLQACRAIETLAPFKGAVASTAQALNWPRDDVYDPRGVEYASTGYPTPLVQAQAEEALALLQQITTAGTVGDTAAALDRARGIKARSLNKASVTYGDAPPLAGGALRSATAYQLLAPLLQWTVQNGVGGLQNTQQEAWSRPPDVEASP
jgi:hypothetical protein